MTDPRAAKYIKEHGNSSWELDALNPRIIRELIQKIVEDFTDMSMLKDTKSKEKKHIKILKRVVDNWENL